MAKKSVFISHSSNDFNIAQQICAELEKFDISCWIAPRNVMGGLPYAEEIVQAIKSCKVLLLIASNSINASEQILNEIEIAVNYSKLILPFKIDTVIYNDSYQYYLKRKHWIEAVPDPIDYYGELVATLKYLLKQKGLNVNTLGNQSLISISERNRKNLIRSTAEKRLSFGLSIKEDEYDDEDHLYECIKRVDVLNSEKNMYSSYRWLTIRNVSNHPTKYIIHKECGDNKVYFDNMRLRAKEQTANASERLVIESQTSIQPNFVQVFKIYFNKVLMPQESMTIFYRIDWPGELSALCNDELSMSISLVRYKKGIKRLIFCVLDNQPTYGHELLKINSLFEQERVPVSYEKICIQDDPALKPLHNQNFRGVRFDLEDAEDNASYRIIYKKNIEIEPDDEDF